MDVPLDQILINVRVADVLDVSLATLIIYQIFRVLRRRADRAVVVGVFVVGLVYVVARYLQMYLHR